MSSADRSPGCVRISRDIWDDSAFKVEALSEREAFVWLIMEARWKAGDRRVGNEVFQLERGQLAASVRFLAEAWGWSKSRVDRYLNRISGRGMIRVQSGTAASVITICKYNEYQGERDSGGTAAGQRRDSGGTKENKGEIREITSPIGEDSPRPIDECSAAVSAFNECADRAGWPKVADLTPERRTNLKARLKTVGGIEGWLVAMKRAEESDFLTGRTEKPFRASFDFLAKKSNFTKLMEGNYDNRPERFSGHQAPRAGGSAPYDGLFAAFQGAASRHS